MSCGKLDVKRFGLIYDVESRVLARCSNGQVAFKVAMDHNEVYVQTFTAARDPRAPSDLLKAIPMIQAAPDERGRTRKAARCCTSSRGLDILRTKLSSAWRATTLPASCSRIASSQLASLALMVIKRRTCSQRRTLARSRRSAELAGGSAHTSRVQ
uniref:Uncharacterized protein n=1 Tax=Peronospora matthiolae TaxID=2874970 RepID=A0AAV1UYF4_9STRA